MITLDADAQIPLYQQLYEQLKSRIISGEYAKGTRLTSTRDLARDLCVGRNTVESAYEQLCAEGYVESRQGSGFVVQDLEEELLDFPCLKDECPEDDEEEKGSGVLDDGLSQTATEHPIRYRFRYGDMDARAFPHSHWRRLTADVLASKPPVDLYNYGDRQGELEFRVQIARYLRQARGVRCRSDQVVLGGGFQDLVGMLCLLLKEEHGEKLLAMEEPGYDFTRILFSQHDYDIVPVAVGEQGMDLDQLRESRARLAYVTPSHQLPMGVVMPIQQRMKMLQWASQVDGLVIEDDYDSELRYRTRPIPSLQSIDCNERVIYLGTFSKAFAPGLRMGYMVLPRWLLPHYHRIFARYKCMIPRLVQYVAAAFMASGRWEAHLRKVCLANRKKRDALIQALQTEMGDKIRVHGDNAGLHILLEFVDVVDVGEMVQRAAEYQVEVYPLTSFWHNRDNTLPNTLLLGFGALSVSEIEESVQLLRQAWFD